MYFVDVSYTNCRGEQRRKQTRVRCFYRWQALCRRAYLRAVEQQELPRYWPCSGQGNGAERSWSVCDELRPWWRPQDGRSRIRLFASAKSASRLADAFNRAEGYPPYNR